MLANSNQATFWPEAVAVMFMSLCATICFGIYRFTGGKWPDDDDEEDDLG